MRALHLLHSLDVLFAYRSVNGPKLLSILPFVMKFALFVCMNLLRSISDMKIPEVSLDESVLRDFILLYVAIASVWDSPMLTSLVSAFKGKSSWNLWLILSLRCLYYSAFTYFRYRAGSSAIELFQSEPRAVFLALFLFFELNGWVLAVFRRDFAPLSSTFSAIIAGLVALDPRLVFLLAPVLMYKHLYVPVCRTFS